MSLSWKSHIYRVGPSQQEFVQAPGPDDQENLRKQIEPWLTSVFQTEHLSLLLGSGLGIGLSYAAGGTPKGMQYETFDLVYEGQVDLRAKKSAAEARRGEPNIEDKIRAALELIAGLHLLGLEDEGMETQDKEHAAKYREIEDSWRAALKATLSGFVGSLLEMERGIRDAQEEKKLEAETLLMSFLLSFASRTASRDRLNVFTTNYDRLVEYGCDLAGIRVIDRFVGALTPIFRSSRLDVDYHYSPPGVRGEPRYLEGVIRLTKLHGSLDWRWQNRQVRRYAVPFGSLPSHPDVNQDAVDTIMIYPNPAKDVETIDFPYAELFRDFSASICRPNSSLVTYGYGFGDDHVNRVLKDMLTIPSTHLVIISNDLASGRIPEFCNSTGRHAQISLLIGSHFGNLGTLVKHYLPKPAIDLITWRQAALLARRSPTAIPSTASAPGEEVQQ